MGKKKPDIKFTCKSKDESFQLYSHPFSPEPLTPWFIREMETTEFFVAQIYITRGATADFFCVVNIN